MNPWVYIVFFGYIVGIVAIGYHTATRRNSDDFMVAGRRMPYWVVGSAYVATYMSVSSFMGVVGAIHAGGWSANGAYIGSVVGYMGGLAIFGPKLRRFGRITIPDFLGDRYDSDVVRVMSAAIVIGGYFLYFSVQFIGIGVLFHLMFGMTYTWSVLLAFAILLAYVMLGGLLATAYIDVIQLSLMWSGGIGVALVAFQRAGGIFDGVPSVVDRLEQSSPAFLNPSADATTLTWTLVLLWIVGSLSRADTISRAYLAINEREVYKAILFSTPFIWASAMLFFFFGLVGAALLPNLSGQQTENTFLIMAQDWAPAILTGMAFTGLLASAQSTVAGQMMTAAMGVSRDTYGRVVAPRLLGREATDREILTLTRGALLVLGALSLTFSIVRPGFIFDFVNLSVAIMGPPFLVTWIGGFFWRRATRQGAILALVLGVSTSVYWFYQPVTVPGVPWLGGPLLSTIVAAIALVAGSLASRPTPQALAVYDRLKRAATTPPSRSGQLSL